MGLFSKKTFVGLDLGHHALKAIQLEKQAGGWKIARSAQVPTPPDSIRDGVVVDTEAVGNAIKQLLREAHISATNAHIAVAGGSVVVRTVRIPKMAEATLRKSIKFEAGRYVPTSVEDSYIEFEIIGPVDDGQMDVIIVAAPKEIVESRMKACEAAGLQVDSVDTEAFAMYRSLVEANENNDWSDSTIAIVDIGASMTNISVISKGDFAMSRAIPSGGYSWTETLENYFKLSVEDAEAGKAQLDLNDLTKKSDKPNENPPLRVLQPHIDDFIREIRRSLNYYQSQQTDNSENSQVSLILLTGGSAKMEGLANYVEHKLGIKTVPTGVYSNPRFSSADTTDETGLDLAVASGLAMRAYSAAA